MSDEVPKEVHHKKDTVEIPVGKFFSGMRKNLWMPAAIVLAIALIVVLVLGVGGNGSSVSSNTAGANLISFINAQGNGDATLVSSTKQGALYQVTVNYQGQDIPVYVTLDGKYLVSDPVPLSGDTGTNTGTDTGTRLAVETGTSASEGSKDAKVTIVEFTDFQCPFCSKYYSETYKQIKTNYIDTGKVRYVLKNFPLTSIHPEAQKAAEAAECVRDQLGDAVYFKYHDKLFENQQSLSVDNEKKWARELDVDGTKFDTCLDSGKMASLVAADESYGQTLGVSGTPAFFINGLSLSGAQPYSAFQKIIDSELAGNNAAA